MAKRLVENFGLTIVETARQLGVTISATSETFERISMIVKSRLSR